MKVLFITGVYSQEAESYFRQKVRNGALQNAANTFQWGIIEGLMANNVDFEVISFPFLPCFPKYKRIYTRDSHIKYGGEDIGKIYKYCTLPIVKEFSLRFRLRQIVKEWLSGISTSAGDAIIMTYTPMSWMTYALRPLKKIYKFRICSIVPDLVDDATNPVFKLPFYKYIQACIEQRKVWRSYSFIDNYVLLSEQMQEKIPQAVNNNVVVEGIASVNSVPEIRMKNSPIRTLLYTGSLEYFTGVKNLVDAFMLTTNPNYRLVICGDGPLVDYIMNNSERDSRIKYNGIVPRKNAVELQQQATALINPRLPNISLTQYSFPSKTIEYLLSGTPMIGYRLAGIPPEYYDFFYTVEDTSVISLKDKIDVVLSLEDTELMSMAFKAQNFILNNKTAENQVRRILVYLNNTVLP